MMYGINIFSMAFSLWALIQQRVLLSCIEFLLTYPLFLWHVVLLSICSATGQVFIFHTLSSYGALVFTIIMTFVFFPLLP
jgi:adenosine 3'-phospho 5'-phosphosulfate transporter B2